VIIFYGDKSVELEKITFAIAEEIELVESLGALRARLERDVQQTIIIISSEVALTEALSISEMTQLQFPHAKVILSRSRLDVDTLSRALRAGVAEVVSAEDSSSFVKSIQHVRELFAKSQLLNSKKDVQGNHAKIVVVFSAKGGCGKTTISINLASSLANITSNKVCLIDLDLQFGDIAVSLQKNPDKTISSAIQMGTSIDRLGARSMITPFNDKLDLLLAPNNPTDVEFISGDIVASILESISNDYDFIVIDTPPAFTDFVLKTMEMMDVCFLVTTLDTPAIKNTKVVLETMHALKIDLNQVKMVINRSDASTGISKAEVQTILEREVDYEIPTDSNVSRATNQGTPNVLYSPKSTFSKVFRDISNDLISSYSSKSDSTKRKRFFGRK
jgi:pilus assembly protein CpaE